MASLRSACTLSLALLGGLAQAGAAWATSAAPSAKLVGYAEQPAATFRSGPTSGAHLGPGALKGHAGPFTGWQTIQGFSGLVAEPDGSYTVLVDNGFGTMESSADHILAFYKMWPDFNTGAKSDKPGKPGTVKVGQPARLHDPKGHITWTITHEFSPTRLLTGADLDPESIARAADGTYWIGDEFGPFLVHVDAQGTVLAPPVSMPAPDRPDEQVRSPQNPFNEETASVRFLNALRAWQERHGATRPAPVLSPWDVLLADGDPETGAPGRKPGTSEVVDLPSLHAAGFTVVPWTVNDRARMDRLLTLGVDGLITDRPDLLREALLAFDANKDGKPGDLMDDDGNVDTRLFDAQGHRGARNLRPESTLPAFEVALDLGMSTLETDCVLSSDDVPILSHEPYLVADKTRRLDGEAIKGHGPAIRHHSYKQLLTTYDRGVKLADRPLQTLDPAASPVAVAYAKQAGLPGPHAVLSLTHLFNFVRFYEFYYMRGDGKEHPEARRRWQAAMRVRFNLETKTSPAEEGGRLTPAPRVIAAALGKAITAGSNLPPPLEGIVDASMLSRCTVQSFDYRTLLEMGTLYPNLRLSFLLEDDRPFTMRGPGEARSKGASPYWPWRVTDGDRPMRAGRSGGFEAMAMLPDGQRLIALLEKPLKGAPQDRLALAEFDTKKNTWTGRRWAYPSDPGSRSVADLTMISDTQGLAIERDDGEGPAAKLKRLYLVTLGASGTTCRKELVADLMNIRDPQRLAGPGQPGDYARGTIFGMPFFTIEGVAVLDKTHVLILNDNNYPFSAGRHRGTMAPDDDEWAVLELAKPLPIGPHFKPVTWR